MLGDVVDIKVVFGLIMLKIENVWLVSWIYVDVCGRDMVLVVNDIKMVISEKVKLRLGISVVFLGQFELFEYVNKKLKLMVLMMVMIIFILLYLVFCWVDEVLFILMSLLFVLVGGIWFLYWQGFYMLVVIGIGFIVLVGVVVEFGVVMLMYLCYVIEVYLELFCKEMFILEGFDEVFYYGVVLCVWLKVMIVVVIIVGLLLIFWGIGVGLEVMSCIVVFMIGGMIMVLLLFLFIIFVVYKLIWLCRYKKSVF